MRIHRALAGALLVGASLAVVPSAQAATCTPAPEADCRGVTLENVSFAEQDLHGVNFDGATLSHVSFKETNLQGATFRDARLRDLSLRGADLTGADLSNLDAVAVNLVGVDLDKATLHFATIGSSSANGASMVGADARWLVAPNTVLGPADLTGADLSWADLGGSDLAGAQLSHAILVHTDLRNARLAGTVFHHSVLVGAALPFVQAGAASFAHADLTAARLTHAHLQSATFHGALLHRTDFESSDLAGASFRDATFESTNFLDAKVPDVAWYPSNLMSDHETWSRLYFKVRAHVDGLPPNGTCTGWDPVSCRGHDDNPHSTAPFTGAVVQFGWNRVVDLQRPFHIVVRHLLTDVLRLDGHATRDLDVFHVTTAAVPGEGHPPLYLGTAHHAPPGEPGGPLAQQVYGNALGYNLTVRGWLLRGRGV